MTPSAEIMSVGQISKVQELIGAGLRKAKLPSVPAKVVLEKQGAELVEVFVADFRRRVEMISNLIIRRFKGVNRCLAPQTVLDTTGRKQYTNSIVVAGMPRGDGEEGETVFFKLDRWVSGADLDKEYELRGLVPADPYSLAKVNQDDPAFADKYPNGTHWKDAEGKWCFAAFYRWGDERRVNVGRDGRGWDGSWWFGGRRK